MRQPATSVRNVISEYVPRISRSFDKELVQSSTDSKEKQTNDDVNCIVIDSSCCNIATSYIILKICHVIVSPVCV